MYVRQRRLFLSRGKTHRAVAYTHRKASAERRPTLVRGPTNFFTQHPLRAGLRLVYHELLGGGGVERKEIDGFGTLS